MLNRGALFDIAALKVLNISVVTLSSTGLGTTFLLLYGLAKVIWKRYLTTRSRAATLS